MSRPEIYTLERASFSTSAFPGNRTARSGDLVRIAMTGVVDRRPVEEVLFAEADREAVSARIPTGERP